MMVSLYDVKHFATSVKKMWNIKFEDFEVLLTYSYDYLENNIYHNEYIICHRKLCSGFFKHFAQLLTHAFWRVLNYICILHTLTHGEM